jgi:hypothetical protein
LLLVEDHVAYNVKLADRAEREARIKQSVSASTEKEDFYDFRDSKTQLSVVRVPIDLLIYRVENFRTFSEQTDYIIREHKAQDFFKTGQENESVQQVQHDILARLAEKGKANSVVPVVNVLRREGQRDTLLITHRGVVVNGNRRLAGMRELYTTDEAAFHQFNHVSCKVLPADATGEDILEIEGKLQAKPETKLEYDWISDAQLLSALLRAKGNSDAVAKFLGRKVKEVKNTLQALAEADLYLKDWAKAPGQYGLVADRGEQLFKDLPTLLQNKTAALQEASRVIAWSLFDNGDKLSGRLYSYNLAFGKKADEVLDQLSDELGVALSSDGDETGGDYEFEVSGDAQEVSYQPLINALRDKQTRGAAVDALVTICDNVLAVEKDERSGSAALKAVNTANAKLAEIDLSRAAKETYESIERQLESILHRATDLRARISKIRNESADGSAEIEVAS